MKIIKTLIILIITVSGTYNLQAQDKDSLYTEPVRVLPDSSKVKRKKLSRSEKLDRKYKTLPDPRRAGLLSAVVPGLGQIYNKKYWKVPLIYGLAATDIYFINWNNGQYEDLLGLLYEQQNTGSNELGLSEDQLINLADEYRRNRDLLIILGVVLYTLNIVDAHVDAHLIEFRVNKKYFNAVNIKPVNYQLATGEYQAGFTLSLKLK
ncbi:DUF5683 domain-containing protein [Mangrovivirga sp. M17]|uniref:DUF5683 domain-containing protein n=1 Tax=Mangrovivirga halotolerans TaxID=2993936 RepID=A0ABT3RW18_9BACT|nr:DUF5683 domain-containing protein [Mangrovivirga halotolerans]MCX2745752.1 DUF5683 domain-containing protein [Mangrovivirga halotolerans]